MVRRDHESQRVRVASRKSYEGVTHFATPKVAKRLEKHIFWDSRHSECLPIIKSKSLFPLAFESALMPWRKQQGADDTAS